jgi:hypothetical protein
VPHAGEVKSGAADASAAVAAPKDRKPTRRSCADKLAGIAKPVHVARLEERDASRGSHSCEKPPEHTVPPARPWRSNRLHFLGDEAAMRFAVPVNLASPRPKIKRFLSVLALLARALQRTFPLSFGSPKRKYLAHTCKRCSCRPPSISTCIPVANGNPPVASVTEACATSSGKPQRRIGTPPDAM